MVKVKFAVYRSHDVVGLAGYHITKTDRVIIEGDISEDDIEQIRKTVLRLSK